MSKEKEFADAEEKKVAAINEDVTKKQKACSEDLARAEPALIAAQEALNTLNKVTCSSQYYGLVLRLITLSGVLCAHCSELFGIDFRPI